MQVGEANGNSLLEKDEASVEDKSSSDLPVLLPDTPKKEGKQQEQQVKEVKEEPVLTVLHSTRCVNIPPRMGVERVWSYS